MTENDARSVATGEDRVVVTGGVSGFAQQVMVRRHRLNADEPTTYGGTDMGPTPYDLLLAALGSCTSMTIGVYARRRKWPLTEVKVTLRHSQVHAADCENCETKEGRIDRIERDVTLAGSLSEEQRRTLLGIAEKCPVHRTLTGEIEILTRLAPA